MTHRLWMTEKKNWMKRATAVLWLVCCLGAGSMLSGESGYCEESTPVIYRLKWLYNTSVVGDLYADVQGFFAGQGLHVSIKEGGPERDAIKEIELGYAQFGVASADQVIRAVAKGSPIVVIAQLFQINPLHWVYRSDRLHVTGPADFKGKTLGVTFGGNDETIMRTLLSKLGIDETSVKLYSVRYDYTPFYEGKVDLWPVYINAQGIIIQDKLDKAGEKVEFFSPDAFGVKFVANSVITSRKIFTDQSALVNAFRKALIEGWRQAVAPENIEAAVDIIRQFDKDTPESIVRRQLAVTRSLIQPGSDQTVGAIDVPAWNQTARIMLDQKLIPARVSLDSVLKPF